MRETEIINRIFELDAERSRLVTEKEKLQFESILPELREKYEGKFFASGDAQKVHGTFFHVLKVISLSEVEATVLENYRHQVVLMPLEIVDMELLEEEIADAYFLMVMEDAKTKFNFPT